jgi:aspartyl aminopeptidase
LNRETNEKFSPNKETHLLPILATVVQEQLFSKMNDLKIKEKKEGESEKQVDKHHSLLIDIVCRELNCAPVDINDLELVLCDTQPAVIGGALDEFIFGPRLDNQVGSYCSIEGLIQSCRNVEDIESETGVRMAAIYDHEEVGSESATGAASALTEQIMRRLCESKSFELAMSRSFLISADQAHAVHPNYSDLHEENHRPSMHGGVVLKYNGNQRYATNCVSAGILREAARLANVPIQDFMVKNDMGCGSTIGPIMSAKLGLTTVDIGAPQLSMHSIRETGSVPSITHLTNLIGSFMRNYSQIRKYFNDVI